MMSGEDDVSEAQHAVIAASMQSTATEGRSLVPGADSLDYKSPKVAFSPFELGSSSSSHPDVQPSRAQGERRISRRSSLTDDRVDEVINNLTNMHSMVKLLRESSVDKPDASRTWDDLANDLEDERTARIIAEEAASSNQKQASAAAAEAASLRQQLALLTQQLSSAKEQKETQDESTQQGGTQQQNAEVVSNLQKQVEEAAAETQSICQQVARLNEQLAQEQSKNEQLRQESATSTQPLSTELGSLRQQHAEATQQLAGQSLKIEQLTQEAAEFSRAQSNSAAAEIASLHEKHGEWSQQLASRQRDLDELTCSTHTQAEATSAELSLLRDQVAAQSQQLTMQHEETQHLSAELQSANKALSSAQQKISDSSAAQANSLNSHVTELTHQLESQRQQTQQLTEQHREAQQVAESSQQRAEAVMAEAASLREQLADLTHQLAAREQETHSNLKASQAGGTQTDSASMTQQAGYSTPEDGHLDRQASGAAASSSNVDKSADALSHGVHVTSHAAPGGREPEQARAHAPGASELPQASAALSEPDLSTAETLDPDSAVVSPARLQLPDQALPGASAFQARLHSMLPQLPTLDKLAQLSIEEWWDLLGNELTALLQSCQWAQAQVGRLEGLECEVDQLQNVLHSVASELESGHQQAQMMQRRTAAAEHALKKAELRVRSAELRAQSAESELAQLRKAHAQQAKHQGSPWKGPGLKPSSPRVSRLPGFEPRLLEPEEHAWDSSSDVPPSSSPPFVGHDDTSSEARAAPKEADSESGAEAQNESAGGFHGGQLKTSKGSAQKRAGSIVGLTQGSGVQRGEGGRGCAALTARKGVAKALPTATAHPLRQKVLPDSRFNSPARSLPPHLRSYRSFTQTALLAMNGSQPEEFLPESPGQIPALGGRMPARRSSSMTRGSKPPKEGRLTKPRPATVQPVLRQSCVPRTALAAGKSTPRVTYGMDSAFSAAKQQYEEQTAGSSQGDLTEHDRTQNWLKNLTTNKAKQASDPKRVDQLVGEFQRLMQENGLDMPLQKSGPCQYRLGSCKLSLKVGSNRLLVRCGGGYEDLMSAIENMPQHSI